MPSNSQRANVAAETVEAYRNAKGRNDPGYNGEPLSDNIGDLLADLMHLCKREGIDFANRARVAEMNFEAE